MSNSADSTVQGALKINLGEWSANLKVAVADIARASDTMEKDLLAVSKQATAQLGSLAKEVQQATAGFARMESQLGDVRLLMSGVDQTTADIAVELKAARAEATQFATASLSAFGDVRVLLNAVDENIHKLTQHMTQAATAAKEVKPPSLPEPVSVNRWNEGLRSLAGIAGTVSPRIGQLVSAFTAVEGAAKSAGVSMGTAAVAVGSVLAAIAGVRAAFNFTLEGIKLAADMEQVSIAFETMTGSAERASKLMRELKEFANTTPFQFPEIAGAAKQLLAMGISAEDMVDSLRRLGDVSSGLSQPLGEMAYLFGQIKSQGRAMTQDLNQFAGRGVPIYRELAAVLGTTEVGVREFAENGKIGFAQIEAAIHRMTDEGGQFYSMTSRQAQSLNGQLSTLADAWDALKTSVGEAFNNPEGKRLITELTAAVTDLTPALRDLAVTFAEVMKSLLPGVREMLEMLQAAMDVLGLHDPYRNSAARGPDQSGGLKRLQATPEGVSKLLAVAWNADVISSASITSIRAARNNNIGDVDKIFAATSKYTDTSGRRLAGNKLLERLRADVLAGKPVDPNTFAQALEYTQKALADANEYAALMRDTASEVHAGNGAFIEQLRANISDMQVGVNSKFADINRILGPLVPKSPVATPAQPQPPAGPSSPAEEPKAPKPTKNTAADKAAAEAQRSEARTAAAMRGANVARLRAQGDELGADLAEAANRVADRLADPTTPAAEKAALREKLAADQALIRKQHADAAQREADRLKPKGKATTPATAPFDPLQQLRDIAWGEPGDRQTLALLELRTRGQYGGALNPAEIRQRDVLRRRVGNLLIPGASSSLFEPGRSPADAARNAVNGASNRQPASGSGSSGPTINVNAPSYNVGELASAISDRLKPYIDKSIAQLRAESNAAAYGSRANGGI